MKFIGKKMPAWLLLAALVVVGAGAATGLVFKDQVNGTTTIAVSQAIRVSAPVATGNSDHDEFLGTADDDGMAWAAHFEANNGDIVEYDLQVRNYGANGDETICLLTMDLPEGITANVEGSGLDSKNPVRISASEWKFGITAATSADAWAGETLTISLAIEDAQPTGFYVIPGTIVPLNV